MTVPADETDSGKFQIPPRLAVDADGYVWRIFDDEFVGELWSMATVNPDNEPVPEPVTFYVPVERARAYAAERLQAAAEQWEKGMPDQYRPSPEGEWLRGLGEQLMTDHAGDPFAELTVRADALSARDSATGTTR